MKAIQMCAAVTNLICDLLITENFNSMVCEKRRSDYAMPETP